MAEIFVGSVSVGVVPDAKTFSDDLRKQILPGAGDIGREYGRQMGQGIKDAVKVQVDELKSELKAQGFDVKVNADTAGLKTEVEKAKAEVEGKSWRVRLHLDQDSLSTLGKTVATQLKKSLGNIALGSLVGTGLASGGSALLAAAGPLGALTLGVGAFAAVAVPELKKVDTALAKTGTSGQKAWQLLTPPERQLGDAIKKIKETFTDLGKTLAPAVDSIATTAVHLVTALAPTIAVFARVGASVLKSFLDPILKWVQSNAFQKLADQFAKFGIAAGAILGPQFLQLIKAFSQLFVQLLPTGLQMLRLLLPIITQLIVALTPGIVILAALATNVLKWVMAHHLLIPALIATLAIIVIVVGPTGLGGIIAATLLVALVVGAFATHWRQWWQDIKNWAQDAWNFLTHGWGQWLIPGLTLIRVTIELVKNHWQEAWSIIKNWARDVWNFIINGLGQLLIPQIKQVWIIAQMLAKNWQATWDQLKSVASSVWTFLQNNVFSPLVHLVGSIPGAFQTAVNNIKGIWNTLKNIFSGPVSFLVNTVYDNGIARLWNDVMNKVGGPTLPTIRFASGGRVPGWGGGDIQPALLEPGETVVSKETSRLLGPIFAAAGVPGYQLGGIIGDVTGFFKGAYDVGRIVTALLSGNAVAAENGFSALMHTNAHGDLGTMMLNVPKMIVKTAVEHVIHSFEASLTGGGGKGITGNVAGDAMLAKEVLGMLGQPISDYVIVLAQEMTESGGNRTAVNKTDINWLEGHPSVGIMQVIKGTFDTYAGPFRNIGPFAYGVSENPLANMYAGMNYAVHEYGPAPGGWTNVLGHGHGYDDGGWWPSGTLGWNTSGHSEYVLTHDMIGSMSGTEYHAHFDGVTYASHEAMTRRAFQQMEIGKGRLARMGRRQ